MCVGAGRQRAVGTRHGPTTWNALLRRPRTAPAEALARTHLRPPRCFVASSGRQGVTTRPMNRTVPLRVSRIRYANRGRRDPWSERAHRHLRSRVAPNRALSKGERNTPSHDFSLGYSGRLILSRKRPARSTRANGHGSSRRHCADVRRKRGFLSIQERLKAAQPAGPRTPRKAPGAGTCWHSLCRSVNATHVVPRVCAAQLVLVAGLPAGAGVAAPVFPLGLAGASTALTFASRGASFGF